MSQTSGRPNVMLLHVPGADLQFIHPLVDAGLMPNLSALIERGSIGNLQAVPLLRYPSSSVSLATGTGVDQHQIFGTIAPDATAERGVRAVRPRDMKTPPLWEMVAQSGLRSAAIGWPVSYPTRHDPNCLIVSDVFAEAVGTSFDAWQMDKRAVSDPDLHAIFDELRLHPSEVTAEMVLPFLNAAETIDAVDDERLMLLGITVARAMTLHGAATWVAQNRAPDLLAVHFDIVERLSTAFFQYSSPKMGHVTKVDFARYSEVMTGAYRLLDMMLPAYVDLASPDTHIMIAAAHGFTSADNRRPKRSGQRDVATALYTERGMLTAAGPSIKPDHLSQGAAVNDLAPTIMALLGLGVPGHLEGRVLDDIFVSVPAKTRVAAMEPVAHDTASDTDVEARRIREWIELGYVAPLSGDAELNTETLMIRSALAHGEALMVRGQHSGARDQLLGLLDLSPGHVDGLMRAVQCDLALGDIESGRKRHDILVEDGHRGAMVHLLDGQLHLAAGDIDAGEAVLMPLEAALKDTVAHQRIMLAIGQARLKAKLWGKAKANFVRAVGIAPRYVAALNGLGEACLGLGDFDGAVAAFRTVLMLNPALAKVRTRLANGLSAQGDFSAALVEFETALALDPSNHKIRKRLEELRKVVARATVRVQKEEALRDD